MDRRRRSVPHVDVVSYLNPHNALQQRTKNGYSSSNAPTRPQSAPSESPRAALGAEAPAAVVGAGGGAGARVDVAPGAAETVQKARTARRTTANRRVRSGSARLSRMVGTMPVSAGRACLRSSASRSRSRKARHEDHRFCSCLKKVGCIHWGEL